ncbi:MAG: MltA domain-containing protein [Rickettsiales bacterium]|nr:MltA domain-containing protein [Pseudomonadota bacterium]MDA0965834.1 MltA domain-containing protein [Pseudomonadota bacterium]MDG4542696.1 MltA domain-containing protein [Rickettsiales bacterium]MDG4545200.1 MltA domain-containing protein [Rickettsiales bacterium]MDG4547323.1 MltA domain-containing protein [Rickettsiales bacterium]
MRIGNLVSLSFLLCFLCSCSLFGDKLTLKEASFEEISGWQDDSHNDALISFLQSCKKFESLPEDRLAHNSGVAGTYGDWKKVCRNAVSGQYSDPKLFFESNFKPYLARNWWDTKGTFTGYYEIELKGSRTRNGSYQYPLYSKPFDLEDGNKYYSRKQIEKGALAGKGYEIAWVDDPVRAFFLHVQGSGRIKMDDGSVMRVGYNGKNGHKYVSIGRYLIDKGYIDEEEMSAQAIKKWLYLNPDKMVKVLNENPSYVFFRELGHDGGPIGGQGVPLTPMRSLAIDKRFVPYGAPVWVDVRLKGESEKEFKSLLIAQDTGGAIKGPVRGDLFFGYGDEAEHLAGYQNNVGHYFILLPKNL